jgi:hypothetical protein
MAGSGRRKAKCYRHDDAACWHRQPIAKVLQDQQSMTKHPTRLAIPDVTLSWICAQVCFNSTQRDWPQVAVLLWVQEQQSRKLYHFIRSGVSPGTFPIASNAKATRFCARVFIGSYCIPQYWPNPEAQRRPRKPTQYSTSNKDVFRMRMPVIFTITRHREPVEIDPRCRERSR